MSKQWQITNSGSMIRRGNFVNGEFCRRIQDVRMGLFVQIDNIAGQGCHRTGPETAAHGIVSKLSQPV